MEEIHGFQDLQHQLLNDTALARRVRRHGYDVILAADPAMIPTPSLSLLDWWRQVMRWHIGMRSVLPRGEYLLYGWHRSPMLLGLVGFFLFKEWPHHGLFLLIPVCARILSGAGLHLRWLREPRSAGQVLFTIATDLVSPLIWFLSWHGGTVEWKGRIYQIREGGAAEEIGRA
jgi:GT2 family glycosyltransferase